MSLHISFAILLHQCLKVANVSNLFNHILIPSLVFKNSALVGSKDKVCCNADLYTPNCMT